MECIDRGAMGVEPTSWPSNVNHDLSISNNEDRDPTTPASRAGLANATSRTVEKQHSHRRKVDSVLDDIMGDPDDFRDLADSDAESDGGRWEDTVRAALGQEDDADGAARLETTISENERAKKVRQPGSKKSNETSGTHGRHDSGGVESPGCSGQNGKDKHPESRGRRSTSNSQGGGSGTKETKLSRTKYFIIKSLNHHNLSKSIERGIWATQAMNEPVLNEAFESAERVLLVFSVNMSGHFQGYAQMTSPIGRRRADVWTEAYEGANPWGGTFRVDWLRLHDLPFQRTVHLKNPLNSFKPVKISRDCQELTEEVGDALCALIDEGSDREGRPKGKVSVTDLLAFSLKRKRNDCVGASDDENQSRQQLSARQNGGMRSQAAYPGNSAQKSQRELHSSYGPSNRGSGGFGRDSPESRFGLRSKPQRPSSERMLDRERDNGRGTSHRDRDRLQERDRVRDHPRTMGNNHSSEVSGESDLLEMTYEEYLQRHGHTRGYNGYQQGQGPGPGYYNGSGHGGSWMNVGAMDFHEDEYTKYINNWYRGQGSMGGDPFYGRGGMGGYPGAPPPPPDPHWTGHPGEGRDWQFSRGGDRGQDPNYVERRGPWNAGGLARAGG